LNTETCDHLLIDPLIPAESTMKMWVTVLKKSHPCLTERYFFPLERVRLPWGQTSSLLFLTMLDFRCENLNEEGHLVEVQNSVLAQNCRTER